MPDLCLICDRDLDPVEIQTCSFCVSAVRRELVGIGQLFRCLPGLLSGGSSWMGSSSGAVEAPLPGGDAMVMLGGGSDGKGSSGDPPAVGWELGRWADTWGAVRGEQPPAGVDALVPWLHYRTAWALRHHSEAQKFAQEMVHIHGWLVRVTGTGDEPEKGAPCFECGASLERAWTDKGREDDYKCPRCHRVYSEASYRLAVAQALYSEQN